MTRLSVPAALLTISIQIVTAYPGNSLSPANECPEAGYMFADDSSMCWYHECIIDAQGFFTTIPRRCALGTKVGYNFEDGRHNPCTVNLNTVIGYECDRLDQALDVAPPCASDGSVVCFNGGTPTYEADRCWCLCDIDWEGDFDCSKPTGFYDALAANGDFEGSNICVDGVPDDDYCFTEGGCSNGATCYNQCRGFWCQCPDFDEFTYVGKRCETTFRKKK